MRRFLLVVLMVLVPLRVWAAEGMTVRMASMQIGTTASVAGGQAKGMPLDCPMMSAKDAELREAIFPRIEAEHADTQGMLLTITGQAALLDANPLLKRSMRNRFPYLDPLNHVQVELLHRYREGHQDERVRRAILLSINGIAAGLRNSG